MIYVKKTKFVKNLQIKMLLVQFLLFLLVILLFLIGFIPDNKLTPIECAISAVVFFVCLEHFVNKYLLNNILTVDENDKKLKTTVKSLDLSFEKGMYAFQPEFYSEKSLYSQIAVLLNNTPLLGYVQDIKGHFLFGNLRANLFFKELVDETLDGERICFEKEAVGELVFERNDEVIQDGRSIYFEKALSTLHGNKCRYRIHKTPLKNDDGEICAVVILARNVDIEKRLSDERETYIATLNHDLKTPTIAQIRAIELLLDGQLGELTKDQKEMLKLTLDSCNYMYNMVHTLLSTYKFENGDISLNYSSFDVNQIVEEAIEEISKSADEYSIKVVFRPEKSPNKICADKIALRKAIINILSNSINYAFPSTIVHVNLEIIDDNLELRVQNSSPYIKPDVMSKLFRKYVTHSEKFNKVGIGLGLYLAKEIVDAHKGRIIAESSQTQHNTFGFSIPVSQTGRQIKKNSEPEQKYGRYKDCV